MSDRDWVIKEERTHYRCGCVDYVHAICDQRTRETTFHRSGQPCATHAAEYALDHPTPEVNRVREAIYDFALEWGKCK